MENQLLTGFAEVSITPQKRIYLAGQFFDRISEYVETPVTATAFAVDNGATQAVICSCDLGSISKNLITAVRENIKGKLNGFNCDNLILCATHSHTSHMYNIAKGTRILDRFFPDAEKPPAVNAEGIDPSEIMTQREAFDFLTEKISQAVIGAWKGRKKSFIANEFARAVIGHCRRAVYDDGSAKMYGDTNLANFVSLEGGNDSGIELLYVFDEGKKLSGVVVNVACPSQVVEHRLFISSDYWGKAKKYLREKFGESLNVLCLCGAAGDQSPRDMVRWVNPLSPTNDPNIKRDVILKRKADCSMFDIEGTWELGRRVAAAVEERFEAAKNSMQAGADFNHIISNIDLPVRKVSLEQYEKALSEINAFKEKMGSTFITVEDRARLNLAAGIIDRYEYQQKINTYCAELHVIKLNGIAIATNPFELFLDYGLHIKARSKAEQTFIIQLACDAAGYLPTERAEKGSHYSAYVTSGITGHQGGNILTSKTLDIINSLF